LIGEGINGSDITANRDWLKNFLSDVHMKNPQAILAGNLGNLDLKTTADYLYDDDLDQSFDPRFTDNLVQALTDANGETIQNTMVMIFDALPRARYISYLGNETLDRISSRLGGDPGKVRAAASFLLTSPGTPMIFFGDEIGMIGLKDPDNRHMNAPMQWAETENAGFSNATPWQPLNPDYQTVNVDDQLMKSGTLLRHYQDLIKLRQDHGALRVGRLFPIKSSNPALFTMIRKSTDEVVLIIINTSADLVKGYQLSTNKSGLDMGLYQMIPLLASEKANDMVVKTNGVIISYQPVIEIQPYGTLIYQIALK
jgi:glycosidase